MDRSTEELLELIRLSERISADIHGLRDRTDILKTVIGMFRKSRRFHAHIIMIDEESGDLRVAATSFPQALVKLGETIAGVSMATFRIHLDEAPLMARVLRTNDTVQASTAESLTDLLPSTISKKVLQRLNYEGTIDILTPLRSNGQPLGILSVTAPGLAEHFIPSLKNLAHHIATSFELADATKQSEIAHRQYRDLVENLNEIIYTVDMTGRITYVSPNVSRIGFTPDDLVGKPFSHLLEGEDKTMVQVRFKRHMSGDLTAWAHEYRLPEEGEPPRWIRVSSRVAMEDGKRVGVRGSITDVTQAKTAEAALREREQILNQTGRMANIAGWEHDIQTGDAIWTRQLYEIIGFDPQAKPPGVDEHLAYYPPKDRIRLQRAYEHTMATGEPFDLELRVNTQQGRRIWCRVYGEAVFENGACVKMQGTFQNIDTWKQAQIAQAESERWTRTLMSNLPGMVYRCKNDREWSMEFISDGCFKLTGYHADELVDNLKASYGSLILSEDRTRVWEEVQQALAEHRSFALEYRILTADGEQKWVWEQGQGVSRVDGESIALEGFITDVTGRQAAEAALRVNQEQLEQALDGTIVAVARIVELRDPYTAGHQERVSLLACAIASEMGHPDSEQEALRVAGLLHDVGKIAVPSEILSKPTRLTDMEMELVRSHAEASFVILKDIRFPWPVADIARQHHERLDGSGYPQGLRGESICPEARILAIADVVEAIASHRPYRPALGIDVALEEIKKGQGSLFDPEAVAACIRVFRDNGFAFETGSNDKLLPSSGATS